MAKVICKVCNPTKKGNGYCAEHSTSGMAYLEKCIYKNSDRTCNIQEPMIDGSLYYCYYPETCEDYRCHT